MITPQHEQEWIESGIDPTLIELNLLSLTCDTPYEYLLYDDPLLEDEKSKLDRRNDGRLRDEHRWEPILEKSRRTDAEHITSKTVGLGGRQ